MFWLSKFDLTFYLLRKRYFHCMRKIILFPCLLVTLSALCQTEPTLKVVKKIEVNKTSKVLSQPISTKEKTKNKVNTDKKLDKKATVSRPNDHLLDLKHEPE